MGVMRDDELLVECSDVPGRKRMRESEDVVEPRWSRAPELADQPAVELWSASRTDPKRRAPLKCGFMW